MKSKLVIILCFLSSMVFGQGEANIWYFGNKAGLDFNSGSPVSLTNGQLNTKEGCATLCNSSGQLLFYTDGITVWNKNHQIMPNGTGLLGNPSATQAATIVPKPGSTNLFYIFTLDFEINPNGFRYSIVDLSLSGGLGQVTTEKNILIYTPTTEKIAVVKHANNIDYWIVTHGWNNNNFYSHALTASGISTNPITTSIGVAPSGNPYNAWGYMRISPDGSKLAVCQSQFGLQLFNFSTTTGVLSNLQTISTSFVYGVEFSPNNNVLYVSDFTKVLQYNLNATNIPASMLELTTGYLQACAIQLAPDKKLYIAVNDSDQLSAINNPNVVGLGCNFQFNAQNLNGRGCRYGLPPFVSSFFYSPDIQLQNSCVGETINFSLNTSNITNVLWNFGDNSNSTQVNPTHIYSFAGTFNVSVTYTSANETVTTQRNIVIAAVPIANQPQNLKICDNDNDGYAIFNLNLQKPQILGNQSNTIFDVRFFANPTDYANNLPIVNPVNYINFTAFQNQTIIAEVYNSTNQSCKQITSFDIQVYKTTVVNSNIPTITTCDNTTIGTNFDGLVLFNLTQNESAILNGQALTEFSASYFKDSALTQLITNPETYQNSNAAETIFVKVFNILNPNCFAIATFDIQVLTLPTINLNATLKQCDDDLDGYSSFNLLEAKSLIMSNPSNVTFAFFETLQEAQDDTNEILNTTNYTNQVVNSDTVFVRVTNANGCYRIAQLDLIVSTTLIPSSFQKIYTECDNAISGSNNDGISTFNFSNATADIQALYPTGQLLEITYYNNLSDALAEQNAITNTANFSNTNYPNTQNIYVRVDSQLNNECLGLGHHITLKVEQIPIAQPQLFIRCDDDQDGLFAFDTTNLESNLVSNLGNVTISYVDQNNNTIPTPFPNPFVTATQTVTATITNNTTKACNYSTSINFVVDTVPQVMPLPISWTSICDDELDVSAQNGIVAFDTSLFQSTLLGGQTNVTVNYFDQQNNPLPSPLPNPFISGTQNIKVEISNANNNICKTNYTIPLKVIERPILNPNGKELICSNNPNFIRIIDAALANPLSSSNYSYEWRLNNIVIPNQTQYTLAINTAGSYQVTVTNSEGCQSIRTIEVTASNTATIDDIEIKDLQADNTISIFVSGLGNYAYSLDNQNFQSENTFTNLVPGFYTVYVKDLNECGIVSEQISIVGIPKFFTPNGDGANDTWFITGINNQFNTKSIVSIFDRYGKLLSQFKAYGSGWDGTTNGQTMPSDDYWYSLQLQDGRTIKGHFALKR